MKILVLNCGSSSVKYQLINVENQTLVAKGIVSKIGMPGALLTMEVPGKEPVKISGEILDHIVAISNILNILTHEEYGVLKDKSEIVGIGHRVVHGGEYFSDSVLINNEVLKRIRDCIEYAPLHNPHNLKGINACMQILPGVPMVAVFDTAFHQNMPDYAYIYGIPYVLYKRYSIRRYGFHGTSHYYVSRRVRDIQKKDITELNTITCHLGNGCSIAAIKKGKSIDTSMGFTPLEGLLMGTRSGDLDPAVVLQVMAREELTPSEATTMLNKHSGLVGISGTSSDMRDIEEMIDKGDSQAELAFNVFCYRLKKYIGAYAAAMGGLDTIVFTGGIGENSPRTREKSLEGLEFQGIELDIKKNKEAIGMEKEISSENSRVKIFVIPTNEELVIAIDTANLVK
ncbi:acetate kinase [bacterium SM23_31]|nr:MAG: acetate kinase [bacterium SM23_31]